MDPLIQSIFVEERHRELLAEAALVRRVPARVGRPLLGAWMTRMVARIRPRATGRAVHAGPCHDTL